MVEEVVPVPVFVGVPVVEEVTVPDWVEVLVLKGVSAAVGDWVAVVEEVAVSVVVEVRDQGLGV
jgi:hypothetical protein